MGLSWNGDDEWRVRWYAASRGTQHRVRLAVRAGTTLSDPADAALAVGLALQRLVLHRWALLVIPWAAAMLAVLAVAYLDAEPAAASAVAGGVAGGVWVWRLLLVGPRLRRAYVRNLAVARRSRNVLASRRTSPS